LFTPMKRPITDRQSSVQIFHRSYVQGGKQARALIVAVIFFFSQLLSAQADKSVRRVLIFNDFHSVSSPGIAILDQAIATGLPNIVFVIGIFASIRTANQT
jgi:hypothetical protein